MTTPTIKEQIRCVEREVILRKRLYPRFIEENRLDPDKAKYEIATMEAALETLKSSAGEKVNQPTLL